MSKEKLEIKVKITLDTALIDKVKAHLEILSHLNGVGRALEKIHGKDEGVANEFNKFRNSCLTRLSDMVHGSMGVVTANSLMLHNNPAQFFDAPAQVTDYPKTTGRELDQDEPEENEDEPRPKIQYPKKNRRPKDIELTKNNLKGHFLEPEDILPQYLWDGTLEELSESNPQVYRDYFIRYKSYAELANIDKVNFYKFEEWFNYIREKRSWGSVPTDENDQVQ